MADQYMQCPQCGGDLVMLDDGKRQCPSCNKTYMLVTRAPSAEAPMAAGAPAAAENGGPVTDRYKQCPQCGGDLFMLNDGKRQCQSCGMKYMLVPRPASAGTAVVHEAAPAGKKASKKRKKASAGTPTAANKKGKKKSAGAVIAVVVVVVLLLAAVGGFLANRFLFGNSGGIGNESTFDTEQQAGETTWTEVMVPIVSTGEIVEGLELENDELLKAIGMIRSASAAI